MTISNQIHTNGTQIHFFIVFRRNEKARKRRVYGLSVAGAVRFELTTRGFGAVIVLSWKILHRKISFQKVLKNGLNAWFARLYLLISFHIFCIKKYRFFLNSYYFRTMSLLHPLKYREKPPSKSCQLTICGFLNRTPIKVRLFVVYNVKTRLLSSLYFDNFYIRFWRKVQYFIISWHFVLYPYYENSDTNSIPFRK